MKKGISITLMLLMIAAMFRFSVATHYCSGMIAASKVSLTGKLAICGMESLEKQLPLHGKYFSKHCCEDFVVHFVIDNKYIPSFSTALSTLDYKIQFSVIHDRFPVHLVAGSNLIYANASPPGSRLSADVDLSGICVFRI